MFARGCGFLVQKKIRRFFAADFYKFRDYYFCIGRIFILRKSVAAPPCLPCRPTFPFVGISHFFCFVSHGGITVPSGPTLLSVHFDISICETCLPLSHVSMFWPSHLTRIFAIPQTEALCRIQTVRVQKQSRMSMWVLRSFRRSCRQFELQPSLESSLLCRCSR